MDNVTLSKPLTAKQSRFIDEYMVDMNGAAAAVRCGYSKKTSKAIACELLTKPDLQAELAVRRTTLASQLQITRQEVIKGLLDGIQIARDEKLPAVMIRGYSELARMLGYFEPEVRRVELSAAQGAVQADFSAMSDVQLLALISQGTVAA
jgi:phage terminase small subunit